jgi:DNA-binding NtrC family response regulator/predicted hydrocarbon binding protein
MSVSKKPSNLPRGHLPVAPAGSFEVDERRFPDLADLMGRLHFSTSDGRIWLDDQRMLLIHARSLGQMRRDMIETLGNDTARGLLTRMGYNAGVADARMARRVRSENSVRDMFVVGPQLHCLEGIGLSELIKLEFDVEKGTHYGEFLWTSPVEDEEQLRHYPIGNEPACWMQIGYASGFTTEFMGRPVLYREVECQSMGHRACRIIGKVVEEWGEEATRDLSFMGPGFLDGRGSVQPLVQGSGTLLAPETFEATAPVGLSPSFNSVLHMVRRVAPTLATVLFLGESGVGKEVFARTLHRMSDRATRPFVALNCAALPENLVESELFGVERGAYTGAMQNRMGRFERADGGTLFLDEVGTLSASAQGKLLRVLQEGELERLGDSQTRRVDVRVIAATNVDLRDEVREGRFREDLFFRLNVFPIIIPPLRERREDIALLATHFLGKFNRKYGRRLEGFTRRAVGAMLNYDWPGNVREMENVIERGVILTADGQSIDAPQLFTGGERMGEMVFALDEGGKLVRARALDTQAPPPSCAAEAAELTRRIETLFDETNEAAAPIDLDDLETQLLKRAYARAGGNLSAAARLLGITRPQMVYRLKTRGIVEDGR